MTKLPLSLLLTILSLPCQAAPSPEEIIEHFFGPDPGPNRADAYIGEMKERYTEEPTVGQMLLPGRHYTPHRVVSSPADEPVYDVTIDNGHEKLHWYAYFVRENGILKLAAARPAERKADDGIAAPAQGR
ncbi:MAG: hypothetical protein ACM3II_01795 [Rhodospirillaceae bacterium]